MSNTEIIDGNRLIAEFLGWEFIKEKAEPWMKMDYYVVKFEGHCMWMGSMKEVEDVLVDGHKFHSSWDKLMPVVKKIQLLKISDFTKKERIMSALLDVDIYNLWASVLIFLNWYKYTKQSS